MMLTCLLCVLSFIAVFLFLAKCLIELLSSVQRVDAVGEPVSLPCFNVRVFTPVCIFRGAFFTTKVEGSMGTSS